MIPGPRAHAPADPSTLKQLRHSTSGTADGRELEENLWIFSRRIVKMDPLSPARVVPLSLCKLKDERVHSLPHTPAPSLSPPLVAVCCGSLRSLI